MYRRDQREALSLDASIFRRFFDRSPLFMLISDRATGRYREVNERFTQLFGYRRDELIGRTSLELGLLTPTERARFEGAEPPDSEGVEVAVRKKDGAEVMTRCWVELSGSLLLIAGEEISERRRLEASLAQGDRLASLGLLAAGIAHEVNNPLAYVVGNLEAAVADLAELSAKLPEEAKAIVGELTESLTSALEGSRRIGRISRTLGTFSRVDRDVREPVDVNAALEAAATLAHNELRFRAQLIKELRPVPRISASEAKVGQVFLSLLITAAHALPEGPIDGHTVTIRTRQEGDWVVVEIDDTGSSATREDLSRLFEPHFGARATDGAGMSLAVTKNLVTSLGGTISVTSRDGRGAVFQVQWPVFKGPLPSDVPHAPAPVGAVTRGRVLVVDDEDSIRRTLARLLGTDHEVVAVPSGSEAKQLLAQDEAFDLILCDLMMPGLTGMDLHAWLVEAKPVLADRLVFLSGGAFTPQAVAYLQRVTNVRLEKPFDPPALRGLVRDRVAAVRRP